ncbi:hypothetical protein [Dyella sp. 20L07]|uniref:hypothetical protein n=1 Tax=Dyella sp. 20L07 TaxID=3384240 RepID=UPI003D2B3023
MTVLALLCIDWRLYVVIVFAAVLSVGTMVYVRAPLFAWAFVLVYGLLVLRDVGHFLKSSRTWPLVREVLDWSKVDERLKGLQTQ